MGTVKKSDHVCTLQAMERISVSVKGYGIKSNSFKCEKDHPYCWQKTDRGKGTLEQYELRMG